MWDWLQIPAGLVTLVVGADLLVRGAVGIALAQGLRPMVVGLTIVAFGTSAPELAASLAAALDGATGLATGTVFGSNIANIGLILAAAALLSPIRSVSGTARFEVRSLLAVTALTALAVAFGGISRLAGAALLAFLLWFTFRLLWRDPGAAPLRRAAVGEVAETGGTRRGGRDLLKAVVGLAALPLGAHWVVAGARFLGAAAGISDQVIGVAVVAVGTSLPELAASVAAALRRHPEVALGNVLGSNLFNLCMVLGGTAVVSPLPLSWAGDGLHVLVGLAFTVGLALLLRYDVPLGRPVGVAMLGGYAAYLGLAVLGGETA